MRKVIFFDLDSTLLQMNQDVFLNQYFHAVAKYVQGLGYEPKSFMDAFNSAAYSIIQNDGSMRNDERFWTILSKSYANVEELEKSFTSFYENEFLTLERVVERTDTPKRLIQHLKEKGYTLILATNPVFPVIATHTRIRWAGLDPSDFDYITTYENSYYCKPYTSYYNEILQKLELKAEDCIMVGNDIDDDFSMLPSGFEKVLITDYLINRKNKEITIPSYTLDDFLKLMQK